MCYVCEAIKSDDYETLQDAYIKLLELNLELDVKGALAMGLMNKIGVNDNPIMQKEIEKLAQEKMHCVKVGALLKVKLSEYTTPENVTIN